MFSKSAVVESSEPTCPDHTTEQRAALWECVMAEACYSVWGAWVSRAAPMLVMGWSCRAPSWTTPPSTAAGRCYQPPWAWVRPC